MSKGLVIRKTQLLWIIVTCSFILSEYCPFFTWMDSIHLKHFLLIAVVVIYCIPMLTQNNNRIMCRETLYIIITAGILYCISLFFQILHGAFKLYSLQEVYYLIMPVIFVFIMFNYSDEYENMDATMTAILYVSYFSFLSQRITEGVLTWSNLVSMLNPYALFVDSMSAMIESDLSNFFLILFIYFSYRKYKFRTIISAIGVFLGYKRFAVLYMLILVVVLRFIPRKKESKSKLLWITIGVFCIIPFVVTAMCTDSFASWFYSRFGIDFNTFTMTRFYIINTVVDADLTNYGLGTITDFLERRGAAGQLNMHCDLLRIYMECTILGTIVFTFSYFKITQKSLYSFITMLFVFVELLVAHFLGPAATSFWIVVYIAIFSFNYDTENEKLLYAEDSNDSVKEMNYRNER